LALKIEINFTKEEILTMYFNNIFYGKNYYGIESASREYFSKKTKDLNLYESALLVQTIPSPNKNNVERNRDRAFKRADRLLEDMLDQGYISPKEILKAKKEGIVKGNKILRPREYRFLFDYVKSDILKYCKDKNGVYTVVLTLEPEMQLYAQLALKRMVKKINGHPQSALLALSPDGAIRAMVGGNSYTDSSMNRTLFARRQPASTFKPIVYLSAIEKGWKPTDKISANRIKIGDYSPKNSGYYSGDVTLRYALKHSINTTAVRLLQKIGYRRVDSLAQRLGIGEKLPHKPHLVLGSKEISMLEMTKVYAVFSNGGKEVIPYGIELIRDKMGNILYEHEKVKQKQIVKKEYIHDINSMLKSVFEKDGTAFQKNFIKETAGKTGTGQNNIDAWFIGYSTYLTTAVWVGFDRPKRMRGVSGGKYPAEAWQNFMANVHDDVSTDKLP